MKSSTFSSGLIKIKSDTETQSELWLCVSVSLCRCISVLRCFRVAVFPCRCVSVCVGHVMPAGVGAAYIFYGSDVCARLMVAGLSRGDVNVMTASGCGQRM